MGMGVAFCKPLWRLIFKKPVITVKMVQPRAMSMQGSTVKLRIKVYNPNPYTLNVTRLTYRVSKVSDGTRIAEGTLREAFTVPPKRSVDAKMEVTFMFSGLGSMSKSFATRGSTRYIVSGSLSVGYFGTITVPYEKEKEFSLFGRSDSKRAKKKRRKRKT